MSKVDDLKMLLAIIHSDGGHYTEANGLDSSCLHATAKILRMKSALELARDELQLVSDEQDGRFGKSIDLILGAIEHD
jgi:hypothetical protein